MVLRHRAALTGLLIFLQLSACNADKLEPSPPEPPAETRDDHSQTIVTLTAEQVKSAQITTSKVLRRSQTSMLEATAEIRPAGDLEAHVGARIAGRISSLKAKQGERVKRGAVLATLDSADLGRAKGDFLAAVAAANLARQSSDREKGLFEKKISAEKDWREAEAGAVKARAKPDAAENRLHALGVTDEDLPRLLAEDHYTSTINIVAPIDGLVVERAVTLGQMVEPTGTLFVVMDLHLVWIIVDVYERDLRQVSIGQKARIKVAAYPERVFSGDVENVGAVIEPKTRAAQARVVVDNSDGALKPGMFATVTFEGTGGERIEALFAPSAAIQREGERSLVFSPRSPTEFAVKTVRLGRESDDMVEIVSGLADGDEVVTIGSFALKSELKKSELGEGEE